MRNMRNRLTRRQVLKDGALAAAALSLPAILRSSPAFAANPVRKSIDSLSADELDTYKHAVKILMDRSASSAANKEGYAWQAVLHNDFNRTRADGELGGCEHRSERFFPWHRAHLAGFEKILRESDPPRTANVTIPYWDWTQPASGVRFPKAFEDTTSPIFHAGRFQTPADVPNDPSLLKAIQWSADDVRNNMVRQTDWFTIAGNPVGSPDEGMGRLEQGPHNKIHQSIGPTMGDPSKASRDPIYWSFHAYIDLVWTRWQRLNTSPAKPQFFSEPQTKIFVEPFIPAIGDMAQIDTMPAGFQYGYDYDFSGDTAPIVVASGPVINRTEIATVQNEALTQSAPLRVQPSNRKLLLVREVTVINDVSYDLNVYVHPPSVNLATLSAAEKARYLADSATIWMSGGHSHRPSTISFDLTKAIAAIGSADFRISVVNTALASDARLESASQASKAKTLSAAGPLWKSLVLEER